MYRRSDCSCSRHRLPLQVLLGQRDPREQKRGRSFDNYISRREVWITGVVQRISKRKPSLSWGTHAEVSSGGREAANGTKSMTGSRRTSWM